MDASEYRRLSQIEDRHWWFRSIHRLVKDQIFRRLRSDPSNSMWILDAGCGTGGLAEKLVRIGTVVGLDISSQALSYAKQKPLTLVQGSVNDLPFRNDSFDVVTSISVLYHERVDDRDAWREMKRVLQPGGVAIIVLPTFSWLASHHDRLTHTKRRYTLSEVTRAANACGFEILDGRYLFSFLFPLFFTKRISERISRARLASDLMMPPWWLNVLLERICLFEWQLGRLITFPFGSSLFLIVKKIQ